MWSLFFPQKYLHESRHRHAMNRVRGEGGRFFSIPGKEHEGLIPVGAGGRIKKEKLEGELDLAPQTRPNILLKREVSISS